MTPSTRARVARIPERGSNDWLAVAAVLDAGFVAHVAFSVEGQPFAIPMIYGRQNRRLLLHGAAASRLMHKLQEGVPACVAVTLVDGLVLARSAFHHSINYRSVVAFGVARSIEEPHAKVEALRLISDHLLPGRWRDVRGPNRAELRQTTVLEVLIEEASAKVRAGPPVDDQADLERRVWAGVLPLVLAAEQPAPHEGLLEGVELPSYLRAKLTVEDGLSRPIFRAGGAADG